MSVAFLQRRSIFHGIRRNGRRKEETNENTLNDSNDSASMYLLGLD
jgi:hypothetical protein